ncbi:transgelin-2-like [Lineus longissimus]|uniref:transgelin-2-like n=1 Tax=Lineus longissimus TaxID=88925 RepID=UPI002B4DB71C
MAEVEDTALPGMIDDANKLLGLHAKTENDVHEALVDGQLLCNKMNQLYPEGKIKVNTSKMAFKKMENIGFFCSAVKSYGIREEYCFQTVDLYESKNMRQVLICLSNLYKMAKEKRQI